MSEIAVQSGQSVTKGEIIGYVGSTGYSTGPHVHFEVLVNGQVTDPLELVR
jgi:murein DD-endopeptidase MepM/ murein hydrolase activator NlpD